MEAIVNMLATRNYFRKFEFLLLAVYAVPTYILPGIVVCVLFAGRLQGYGFTYRVMGFMAIHVYLAVS